MAEERTLDTIGIRPGLAVEVLTLENNLTFQGRMEKVWDHALQINDPSGGELPPVLLNREIKLRCSPTETQVVILRGQVCGSTQWMWKVDRLQVMHIQEQRGFFRQRIQVDAHLSRGGKQTVCELVDISAGGVMLRKRIPIPPRTKRQSEEIQVEDRITLGDVITVSDARIVSEEPAFSFRCRVVRETEKDGWYVYGCQFEGLSSREQDRLIRAIFITQRKERQARQKRSGI